MINKEVVMINNKKSERFKTNIRRKSKKAAIRCERGFSLIEVLIAMGISLVILAAAIAIMKSMTDSSAATSRLSELNSDNQAAMNLIRRDLQQIGGSGVIAATIPELETLG
ncbi:MAG: prepilin-type N-terminal cleavage/methylation domain-containing protein, partial [Acidobacteriota bacterium]|nr:prepilin-type N-terminal cleavage/methylation domain-containing protein [Acidobacteriota bacterium]